MPQLQYIDTGPSAFERALKAGSLVGEIAQTFQRNQLANERLKMDIQQAELQNQSLELLLAEQRAKAPFNEANALLGHFGLEAEVRGRRTQAQLAELELSNFPFVHLRQNEQFDLAKKEAEQKLRLGEKQIDLIDLDMKQKAEAEKDIVEGFRQMLPQMLQDSKLADQISNTVHTSAAAKVLGELVLKNNELSLENSKYEMVKSQQIVKRMEIERSAWTDDLSRALDQSLRSGDPARIENLIKIANEKGFEFGVNTAESALELFHKTPRGVAVGEKNRMEQMIRWLDKEGRIDSARDLSVEYVKRGTKKPNPLFATLEGLAGQIGMQEQLDYDRLATDALDAIRARGEQPVSQPTPQPTTKPSAQSSSPLPAGFDIVKQGKRGDKPVYVTSSGIIFDEEGNLYNARSEKTGTTSKEWVKEALRIFRGQ